MNQKSHSLQSASYTQPTDRPLVRPKEAQRLLGIGHTKFWNLVSSGYIEVHRPFGPKSRIVYVKRADLERLVG
jgi:hypothetical protein